ncbi:MAG: hypothetical protein JO130_03530 [Solirubrobacterales bacterium]|nr:hypothetical protein [Solirubrobacterales bacterium]
MGTVTRIASRRRATAAAARQGGVETGPRVPSVATGLFVLATVAFGLVLASNLISLGLDQLRTTLINANWEFSWSHEVDTVLLAIGTGVSVVGARASTAHRRLWLTTAMILAVFFLDEASALHGQIGNLDKLLYVPILVALVLCVRRLTDRTPERMLVTYGLTTLFFAFAMHVAGLHLIRPIGYTTYVYQTAVGFKEGAELAGLILIVAALWRRAAADRTSRAS